MKNMDNKNINQNNHLIKDLKLLFLIVIIIALILFVLHVVNIQTNFLSEFTDFLAKKTLKQ
ncbi:hypothetical protein ISS06_02875 [Patescibacteria group bacterium]|nr:hypothetical protein [Patescibacteria group bacterium]